METRGRPQWLDREECFDLWWELGSIKRVRLHLGNKGIVNPTTGEIPSESGVRIAAHKYVLFNQEDARKRYMERGLFLEKDEDKWVTYLKRLAITLLTTRRERYEEWEKTLEKYTKNTETG